MLYADNAVHKTIDGGESWNIIYENTLIKTENTFHILDENTIFVSRDGEAELAFTNDGGDTWEEIDVLTNEYRVEDVFSVGTERIALVAINSNEDKIYVFTKDNGDENWSQQYQSEHTTIGSINTVYTSDNTIYLLDTGNTMLLETTDGGDTWTENTLSGVTLHPSKAAISFINANKGWAYSRPGIEAGNPGIYKTNDGGENWELLSEPVFPHDAEIIEAIHFKNELEGVAITSAGGYLLTEDGGQHWRQYYLPLNPEFIHIGQQEIFFRQDGNLIKKSL